MKLCNVIILAVPVTLALPQPEAGSQDSPCSENLMTNPACCVGAGLVFSSCDGRSSAQEESATEFATACDKEGRVAACCPALVGTTVPWLCKNVIAQPAPGSGSGDGGGAGGGTGGTGAGNNPSGGARGGASSSSVSPAQTYPAISSVPASRAVSSAPAAKVSGAISSAPVAEVSGVFPSVPARASGAQAATVPQISPSASSWL